jgi:ribose-phosphate pyrophosphokinase
MILTVLAGSANVPLANAIAAELGVTPRRRVAQRFADTELHVVIEETVRGHDVYLIQPTSPPVDEHVMELLFLADACRRAGATRLTAVTPYFGYARQDRRAAGREPIGARVVAELIEAAGFDRVIAIDLHTPAIEGFFRLPLEHLSATSILAEAVRPLVTTNTVVVAPDMGAAKLAERYQELLNVPLVVLRKTRLSGHEVAVRGVIGDSVRERAPLIVDDMITTGATIEAAVNGLLAAGCLREITVAATHALFVGPALERLRALPIHQMTTTNSVAVASALPFPIQVVNLAPIIAERIARLHRDQSLTAPRGGPA